MGTSLTGLTPATTYDALIKVGDNGPLSATAKVLSDGLGNDSPMSMSTTKVGINTSTPEANLHISGDASNRAVLRLASTAANRLAAVTFYGNNVESATIGYEGGSEILGGGAQGDLIIRNVLANKNIILHTNAGNVGIGTSSPAQTLSVEKNVLNPLLISLTGSFGTSRGVVLSLDADNLGANESALKFTTQTAAPYGGYVFSNQGGELLRIVSTGGITFNGDTAAANALDDYEEGTWTPVVTFGGASVGIAYTVRYGRYTKIGNQVNATCYVELNSKGTSTGSAIVGGLPFNNNSASGNYAAPAIWFQRISYANILNAILSPNGTGMSLTEVTEAGTLSAITDADFQNTSEIIINLTYAV